MRVIRRPVRRTLVICIVSALFLTLPYANSAVIQGVVTDPLGAAVSGATIALIQNGKLVTNTRSGPDGSYTLSSGAAGRFYVLVSGYSFKQLATQSFYAGRLDSVEQNVILEPETVRQSIVVTATGLPVPQAQTSASVGVIQASDLKDRYDLIDPMRQIPGVNVVSFGQIGSAASTFIRGGNSDANKVLVDGVPVNDIGGRFDLSTVSSTAVSDVEVFRGPDSVLYGSDASAGVISITTPRGSTSTPTLLYEGDAGNYYTYRNEVQVGGTRQKVDYYGAFSRLNSSNDVPMSEYHNVTSSLNVGWSPTSNTQIRGTARNADIALGLPGAYNFYLIPNDGKQSDQNLYVSGTIENQTGESWHNLVRYGLARKREESAQWYAAGIPIATIQYGAPTLNYYGLPVLIEGANGYAVTGQAQLNSGFTSFPNSSSSVSNLDQLYAQSDYKITPHITVLLGFRYVNERGAQYDAYDNDRLNRTNYDYTAQFVGDFKNRFFYELGGGVEKNGLYGIQGTPRTGLTYYVRRPGPGAFRGTKLTFNFAKGVQEPNLFSQFDSLYGQLLQYGYADIAKEHNIGPIGAEDSRTYDGGVEQSLFSERMVVRATFFHNEFGNQTEFVSAGMLPQLGVSPEVAAIIQSTLGGADVNSLHFRALGFESQVEYQPIPHLFLRGGYTYLDAVVQNSFASSATSPSYNTGLPGGAPPSFSTVPIGATSPLVGARPFRRPPHTGFASLSYSVAGFSVLMNAAFSSASDDSTFLGGYDFAAGNSLLLPNRNLDYGFAKVDLGLNYQINSKLGWYTQTDNIFNQGHTAPIGYPSLPINVRTGIRLALGGRSK